MLCSPRLANKMSQFEVLTDYLMRSDHAPIMCKIGLDKAFKVVVNSPKPRYNFKKSDWNKFGQLLDSMITNVDSENISDLNEILSSAIIESADQSIPKILKKSSKNYPPHIIELIKLRKEIMSKKKKISHDKLGTYNTEYNRLTCSIKLAIKTHIEKKLSLSRLFKYFL